MGSHFGVGEFTTHFRTYFSGDWDVHRGLTDLGFDPWPCIFQEAFVARPITFHLLKPPGK